ncbi:ABC transporter substrate-binding protein [Bacillus sp. TS-2]|nr:ABC transporter substrate-binding protein [Bacillus sp. TS-2]
MKFKKYLVLLLVSLMAVIFAACGSDAETGTDSEAETETEETETETGSETTENEDDGTSSEELEGSVVIDGSGTVYPLMALLAEEYMINEQEGVSVEVSRAGTGAGFQRFLAENGTDFNDASREIKDEEQQLADELGIEVKELKVALDGLTFVINPENDWATELTKEQLIQIFSDESIQNWSDLDPSFPNEEINTYGPNENHGTYEFFFDEVLDGADLVSTVNLQQDYSTLVNLISEDPNGIAFFGFGYYVSNQDKLEPVSVDFGEGAVTPSLDTIGEGDADYATFTRPVFTYLNVDHATEKPEVLDFAIYVMNNINVFAGETGFAPIPDEEVQEFIDYLEGL